MSMWDQQYRTDTYVYGTAPNDYLTTNAHHLPAGNVLCLGDGEGRNGVWLAEHGWQVTAVDISPVGLTEARDLAVQRGLRADKFVTVVADLADYELGHQRWDGIVSIFCHLPPSIRVRVHRQVRDALTAGGVLLYEGYHPNQIGRHGGPPRPDLTPPLEDLRRDFDGLEILHATETERVLDEGNEHQGLAAVVQLAARRAR
jgi:SAM-dependent methyltransferase